MCEPFPQGLPGFIPKSQLLDPPSSENKSQLIGKTPEVIVKGVDSASGKLVVLSEKEARKDKYVASLKVRSLAKGKVSGVQSYGFLLI